MAPSSADIVRANSEAFSRRDVDAMMQLFAPDAVVRDRRAVGWGDFLGRDAIRAYYEGLFDNVDEIYEDLAVASASAGVVVAPCHTTARLAGQPDAALVTFDYALKVTVADGLIQALEIYEDAKTAGTL
jgi:ketosteroid isomerase-like protein